MTERMLTTREPNRAVLARQLLLERSSPDAERAGRAGGRAADAVRAVGVLGPWPRLAGFRRDLLTEALHAD
ncbi:MAG: hypothetical protein LH603_05880 [Pseudonocardia sp.]|nr:hypothetical protein [Pseudonocardia sp.]